ncbi:MAG: (d)CMP kinase [Clostridia bacterium]|nr:(d)CMP kinase [Clostridia bacterium]
MIQIAIDGPSGAGKSTVAKLIAKKMGIVYVDTGALYRTVGYYVRQKGVDPKSHEGVSALLGEIDIQVKYENGEQCVYLNGENLGDKIRQNEISKYASDVSAIPAVRAFLLDTQKSIASQNSVVMDGRDIGTVILPNADVKIFLTATDEERAKRRYNELIAKGADVRLEDILKEMKERDANDKGRKIAPAIPAEDAIIFDNTGLTGEESCEKILEIVRDVQNKRKEGVLQPTN